MSDRIRDLLRSAPLIDGHNDLLWALREAREKDGAEPDIAGDCSGLQTDLPRLETGGVGAQFWSAYVPSHLPPVEALTKTLEQIDALNALVVAHPDRLELARTADDVERIARWPDRVVDRRGGRPPDRRLARHAPDPGAAGRRLPDRSPTTTTPSGPTRPPAITRT